MEWQDGTSYSQSERRAKAPPRTWVLPIPGCQITVTLKHFDPSGTYYMCCPRLDLVDEHLGTTDPDVAKVWALNRVDELLRSLTRYVRVARRDLASLEQSIKDR
jgi:hypothetical protein